LGEILVEGGLINRFQLETALSDQRSWGGKLGQSLVRIGAITKQQLLDFLSEKFNVAKVDLRRSPITEDTLNLVPRDTCWKYKILPVAAKAKGTKKGILVAMSDPTDLEAIQEVEFLTGYRVKVALAHEEDIEKVIDYCYSADGYKEHRGQALEEMIDVKPDAIDIGESEMVIMTQDGNEKVIHQDNRTIAFRGLRVLIDLLIEKGIITQEEYTRKMRDSE